MALIKCPECGKEISENAEMCPNCGLGKVKIKEIERRKKWDEDDRYESEILLPKIKEYLDIYGIMSEDNFKSLDDELKNNIKLLGVLQYCDRKGILCRVLSSGKAMHFSDQMIKEFYYYLPIVGLDNAIKKRLTSPKILSLHDKENLIIYKEECQKDIINFINDNKVFVISTIMEANLPSLANKDLRYICTMISAALNNGDCKRINLDKTAYFYLPTLSQKEFDFYKLQVDKESESIKERNIKQGAKELLAEIHYKNSLNGPKCPTCGSTNISSISTASRMFSVSLFGIGSSNVGKTKKCNNCGYKW